MYRFGLASFLALCLTTPDCRNEPESRVDAPETAAPRAMADAELDACLMRERAIQAEPELPGDPAFDASRVQILGRARGEPVIMTTAPKALTETLPPSASAAVAAFQEAPPGLRVGRVRTRVPPEVLRALVLREGYAYATEPLDALSIVSQLSLKDLFTEPSIWLQRGSDTRRLERAVKNRETSYRYVDGPLAGRAADLLFGDRVALGEDDLANPIHRDLKALADREGFDRARIVRLTEHAILADVRYGSTWARAVMTSEGAKLSLACIAEDADRRGEIAKYREETGAKRRALLAMHDTVTEEVHEAFRFDRPQGVEGPDQDGELRPQWMTAYLQGRSSFEYEGTTYAVFDGDGRAWPPEVCVDFVLDTFERTSGTWFQPRGEKLGRVRGKLDFDDTKFPNRRGVIAFGAFAEQTPDLFDIRRFHDDERIQFKDRGGFFAFFGANEDEVKAGDVVAIHGMKADHRIHQHAILVEWTDPITGFPYGLADQMRHPRRRTWEGIMAEAPLRSLLYRVRPKPIVFERLDPGD